MSKVDRVTNLSFKISSPSTVSGARAVCLTKASLSLSENAKGRQLRIIKGLDPSPCQSSKIPAWKRLRCHLPMGALGPHWGSWTGTACLPMERGPGRSSPLEHSSQDPEHRASPHFSANGGSTSFLVPQQRSICPRTFKHLRQILEGFDIFL